MKHFEEVWEKAEIVASSVEPLSVEDRISDIKKNIDLLSEKNKDNSAVFGRILFQLCGLSHKLNVNTFASLLNETKEVYLSQSDDVE